MTTTVPGYVTGTWNIDGAHTDVEFTIRHLGISKVRGRFNEVTGTIVTADNVEDSSATVTISAASIDTGNADRDNHVKGDDFLAVESYPTLTFTSTGIRRDGEGYAVDGELTVHGVTKPVTLSAEFGGIGQGMAEGSTALGASATTEIKRSDFGVGANIPTSVLGDKVTITIDVEAVLEQ